MNTQDLKGVLLDAEGTFLHIHPSVGHVYCYVMAQHGHECDPAQINDAFLKIWHKEKQRKKKEISRASNYLFWKNIFLKAVTPFARLDDPEGAFKQCYHEFSKKKWWRLAPNFLDTLHKWSIQGLKIGVVSNWDERLLNLIQEFEISDLFHSVIISTEVGLEKPDPEIVRLACQEMDIRPDQAVLIGDSAELDCRAAAAAGCKGILYDPKARSFSGCCSIGDFGQVAKKEDLIKAAEEGSLLG